MNVTTKYDEMLPMLRALVGFLRVKAHRDFFADWLTSYGLLREAQAMRKRFNASFLHWRWNTLADCMRELTRLRVIVNRWFRLVPYKNVKDKHQHARAKEASMNMMMWDWIEEIGAVTSEIERAREWGLWCRCHDWETERNVTCRWKGRRLPMARFYVQEFKNHMSSLRENGCKSMFPDVIIDFHCMCSATEARVALKFQWLWCPPWSFVECGEPEGAKNFITAVEATPAGSLHRVTERLWAQYEQDIRLVAEDRPPSVGLTRELHEFSTLSLSEGEAEGYHRDVCRACENRPASQAPFIFSELRLNFNMKQIKELMQLRCGEDHLVRQWKSFKSVVRVSDRTGGHGPVRHRGTADRFRTFTHKFYRLGEHRFEALPFLSTVADKRHFPGGNKDKVDPVVLDYCRKVLIPGKVYACKLKFFDGSGEQGDKLFMFTVLFVYSGQDFHWQNSHSHQ